MWYSILESKIPSSLPFLSMRQPVKISIADWFFESNSRLFEICLVEPDGKCLSWEGGSFFDRDSSKRLFVNLLFIKREQVITEYIRAVAVANKLQLEGKMVLIDLPNPENIYHGRN